nr:2-oxo acid dehydrogenase subunit E2 [Saprospiraceae bacterium]
MLAEVETDKATMDLESFYDGNLLFIGVEKGTIAVNAILAVIGKKGEDYKAALASAEGKSESSSSDSSPNTSSASAITLPEAATEIPKEEGHIKASPLAKVIAKEGGIDLKSLTGTGDQGRIIKRDIETAMQNKGSQPVAPVTPSPAKAAITPVQNTVVSSGNASTYEDKPLSQMRKTIARRLSESMFTAPHFYVTMAIDMTKAVSARAAMNVVAPSKLSFNDLVVKACALALRKHPVVNSSWAGDAIRQNNQIH